jgi:hypothetical protein
MQRGILSRFNISLVAIQWAGCLLAILLAFAWLQIPDSHVWQFVFSVISGLLLAIAFCSLQVMIFSRLRTEEKRGPFWLRIVSFAVIAGLWIFLARWIGSWSNSFGLYAGYWNSKLSPALRVVLTPGRIEYALNFLSGVAIWALLGFLLPIAIEACTAGPAQVRWNSLSRPYRKVMYWLAVVIFGFAACLLTQALVSWIPPAGVRGQIVSVLARLGVAYTVDIVLWCLLIAITAAWMTEAPASDEFEEVA